MTKITIDVADFGGVTHRGDHVIFNSPMFHPRAGSTTSIVSPAPRRIPLKDGKAVVADVAPGVLEVRFRVKNLVDTAPFKVMVPDVDEISLRTLLVDEFENTPVVVSTLQALITSFNKNMDKREQGLQITLTQAKQAEQGAQTHAREAERQAREAAGSATKAGDFKTQAQQAANRAETSEEHTRSLEMSAGKSAQTAKQSAADTQADRAVIQGFHTSVSSMVAEVEKDRAEVATNTGTVAENTEQAGGYARQAEASKVAAEKAAVNAGGSERAAKTSEVNAAGSATRAEGFKNSAEEAAATAGEHEIGAGKHEANAGKSAQAAKQSEVNAGNYAKTAQTQRELTENVVSNFSPTVTKVENLTVETKGYRDQAETYAKKAIIGVQPDSVTEGMLTPELRNKLDSKVTETTVSDSSTAPQGTIVQRGKDGRVPTRLTPTYNDEAASKQYVDQRVNTKANSSHKHVSTDITDAVQATAGNTPANKIVKTGDGGHVHAVTDPTHPNHVTRKAWVDARINSVTANAEVDGRNKAGGKLVKWDNGGRILTADPAVNQNPVTLGYLNNKLGGKVDKSTVFEAVTKQGDIVARSANGNISVPLTPGDRNAAASKQYVDNALGVGNSLIPNDPATGKPLWLTVFDKELEANHNGWPRPEGNAWRASSDAVDKQATIDAPTINMRVTPGTKYKLTFWARATKPDTVIYIEARDQNGNHAVRSGTVGRVNNAYLVGNYIMPTKATKEESVIEFNDNVTSVRLARVFFNHQNGSNAGVQCIAGFNLYPLPAEETTLFIGHGSDSASKVVKTRGDGQVYIYTDSIKQAGHAANKQYVDSGLSKKVDVSLVGQGVGAQGQIVARTQGGNITVPNEPTSDNHAASKKYVDGNILQELENFRGQTGVAVYLARDNGSLRLFPNWVRSFLHTRSFGASTIEVSSPGSSNGANFDFVSENNKPSFISKPALDSFWVNVDISSGKNVYFVGHFFVGGLYNR